ncbi:MAG: hypothetical protein MI919_22460, partial [Holophagales bacterium]|nr:hypothetical protein [Holophagales bacterium]
MKVSLSRKGTNRVTTRENLQAMDRASLKDDQAFEVEDGKVFAWDSDQEGQSMSLAESFPLNDKGVGRWIAQPRGSRVSAEKSAEEHEFFDPLLDKTDKVSKASKAQPFSVVEDFNIDIVKEMNPAVRSAHTAIIELVTEPRDEFQPEE